MIRKTFLFAALILMATLGLKAQQAVGEWKLYSYAAGDYDEIIDTPTKVYYLTGQRLFSYDKESGENYSYSTMNRLNDTNITNISYNADKGYLFVYYDTSNIDLIYDDGNVVNMSDIKDAVLTSTKALRNVNFAGDRIYLGTDFGIVIYDDINHRVVESGIYNMPVNSVAPMGDVLLLSSVSGDKIGLYYAPLNGHHNTLEKFKYCTNGNFFDMQIFGDNTIVAYNSYYKTWYKYVFSTVTADQLTMESNQSLDIADQNTILTGKDGRYIATSTQIIKFGNDGSVTESITLPDFLAGQKISTWNGVSSLWAGDSNGLGNYDINSGNITVLSDKFRPQGIYTDMVAYLQFDTKGRLWTSNIGSSRYRGLDNDYIHYPQRMTRIDTDGTIVDVNCYDVTLSNGYIKQVQAAYGDKRMYGGVTRFAVDLENPERYYLGNMVEGLFVFENGEQIHAFNWSNSPLIGAWGSSTWDVNFDPDGNLWVGIMVNDNNAGKASPYYILPKEKLRGDLTKLTTADWVETKHATVCSGQKDMGSLLCKKSPVMLSFNSSYEYPLGVYLTNGTWGTTSDDRAFELIQPLDQDGKAFVPRYITCAIEDQRGRVWVGSTSGIIEITNPATLTEASRVSRIKVPRNDGTNLADYLCETDQINDMAVDPSNRKWIATNTSGLYLVSEDGDRIIEHFTSSNSPIIDNCVLSVACDPASNTVYIGTPTGLLSYNATSSPTAESYDNVYAYPNPVRPEYTGYITITNLMDNSLVKITDAAGNVVYQTRSEGGMATWDGLDNAHNRVKSGVYYVFASQNENDTPSGAVTKILIVR